jgi:hypothetical protein
MKCTDKATYPISKMHINYLDLSEKDFNTYYLMRGNICKVMLLLNTAWDFMSAIAIWWVCGTKDVIFLDQRQPLVCSNTNQDEVSESNETDSEGLFLKTQQKIASMHTAMWSRHVDTNNHAACMLMAWWILTLGCMRFLAAIMWNEWLLLAIVSYGIEAAAFTVEGMKSTMIPKKACPASIFSLICLVICGAAYY